MCKHFSGGQEKRFARPSGYRSGQIQKNNLCSRPFLAYAPLPFRPSHTRNTYQFLRSSALRSAAPAAVFPLEKAGGKLNAGEMLLATNETPENLKLWAIKSSSSGNVKSVTCLNLPLPYKSFSTLNSRFCQQNREKATKNRRFSRF